MASATGVSMPRRRDATLSIAARTCPSLPLHICGVLPRRAAALHSSAGLETQSGPRNLGIVIGEVAWSCRCRPLQLRSQGVANVAHPIRVAAQVGCSHGSVPSAKHRRAIGRNRAYRRSLSVASMTWWLGLQHRITSVRAVPPIESCAED
jgi:hypothetical protein